jgi:hypothetical protein
MPLSTIAKNSMLDAVVTGYVSLHTAYSTSGANEVTGGSPAYSRSAATFASASAASKALSNTPVVNVPTGTTVKYIGLWSAQTNGTFISMTPNGGSEKEFYADPTANAFTAIAHGFNNDDRVVFVGDTPPSPLVEGTEYFVVNKTTDTFQVATTQGGSVVDITTAGGGACLVSKIVLEVFGAQGTFTVSSLPHSLTA